MRPRCCHPTWRGHWRRHWGGYSRGTCRRTEPGTGPTAFRRLSVSAQMEMRSWHAGWVQPMWRCRPLRVRCRRWARCAVCRHRRRRRPLTPAPGRQSSAVAGQSPPPEGTGLGTRRSVRRRLPSPASATEDSTATRVGCRRAVSAAEGRPRRLKTRTSAVYRRRSSSERRVRRRRCAAGRTWARSGRRRNAMASPRPTEAGAEAGPNCQPGNGRGGCWMRTCRKCRTSVRPRRGPGTHRKTGMTTETSSTVGRCSRETAKTPDTANANRQMKCEFSFIHRSDFRRRKGATTFLAMGPTRQEKPTKIWQGEKVSNVTVPILSIFSFITSYYTWWV